MTRAILTFAALFGLFIALPAAAGWLLMTGHPVLGTICLATFGLWCWRGRDRDKSGFGV